MNGIKAFVMFFTTISVTFYIFTFLTVIMLFWLLEKRITVKPMLGYSLAVMAVFYVMMFAGRGFNITFLWNGSFYLAVLLMYIFFLSVALKLINLFVHLHPRMNLAVIAVSILIIFVYGIINAASLTTRRIEISSDKITRPYKFVQISDVHLGTESLHFLEKVIDRVNEIGPETVFITGDFIDDHKLKPEELKVMRALKAPAYFITGNHERYSNYTDDFFKDCNVIKVLDHRRRQDDFNGEISVYGIEWNRKNFMNRRSEQEVFFDSISVDTAKFNIFLNHEPELYDRAEKEGMDLMLSGHTHRGQIFPFWFFVRARYKYIYGLYDIGRMKLYTTSGTGVWGPFMRVGSTNEIVEIDLVPEK